MEKILQIPCELVGSQTKSISKTTKLTFESQENISPDLISQITGNVGKVGWLAFLPEERPIDTLDVVGLPPLEWDKDEKTPGQRLRACLFVLWEQKKPTETFAQYYSQSMERIINVVKEKLV